MARVRCEALIALTPQRYVNDPGRAQTRWHLGFAARLRRYSDRAEVAWTFGRVDRDAALQASLDTTRDT